MDQHKDIPELTPEQYNAYYNATNCECYGFPFNFPEHQNGNKMRHHDHVTGEYIGAWCRRCNFNEGERFKRAVMFHNFRSYDSHFIIRYALKYLQAKYNDISEVNPKRGRDENTGKNTKPKSIKQFAITKSSEKFSQLVFGNYEFMDTFLHLNTSLDNLVEQLRKYKYDFPISNRVKLEACLRQKGIFPHSYITSFDKLKDKSLLPIEAFRNDLTNKPCSQEDYNRAKSVWDTVKCQSLMDYMLAYLKADVVLLAEVYENYRNVTLKELGLDPCRFITAASMTYYVHSNIVDVNLKS
jgi:hypothetical protein